MKQIVQRIFELRAVEKYSYESIGSIIRQEFQSHLGQRKYKFNKSSIEATTLPAEFVDILLIQLDRKDHKVQEDGKKYMKRQKEN